MRSIFLLSAFFFLSLAPAFAAADGSVYDRVMDSGTIRCGYFSWYPDLLKDPSTGEFKGILYEYMNEVGKALNLKIEWTEEIPLGEYPVALENGRIDAMCAGGWQIAERARIVDYVTPAYYLPLYPYARKDDHRFDADLSALNDPQYRLVVLEGGVTSIIRRHDFPLSTPLELPLLTSPAELFMSLAAGKADIAIYDSMTFRDFETHNQGQLRQVSAVPVRVFPHTVAVMRGQEEFRRMLDHATTELLLSGTIDKIIDRHDKYPGAILRAAKPYGASP
ncbi:MAG: transporter substrate-binding domain-containing protein [Alphaproteobacteria bacterium]|nr:transporter substrate-binding domain-containing protein [Alphaproteobacteria bacterium]